MKCMPEVLFGGVVFASLALKLAEAAVDGRLQTPFGHACDQWREFGQTPRGFAQLTASLEGGCKFEEDLCGREVVAKVSLHPVSLGGELDRLAWVTADERAD